MSLPTEPEVTATAHHTVTIEVGTPFDMDGQMYRGIKSTFSDGFVCLRIVEYDPNKPVSDVDGPVEF